MLLIIGLIKKNEPIQKLLLHFEARVPYNAGMRTPRDGGTRTIEAYRLPTDGVPFFNGGLDE